MPKLIEVLKPPGRTVSVFEQPLTKITPALRVGTQLREIGASRLGDTSFPHVSGMVRHCAERRGEHLKHFAAAANAQHVLLYACDEDLDRQDAAVMVAALLGAFGAKSDKDVLAGMLDMLDGDEIAAASGLWRPLRVSPAALAIACRKLIATATFPPRPAELYKACREASGSLKWAQEAAEGLCDYVRRCDAVLLEFAPDEWRQPYLTATYQPVLPRMLALHDIYGDGSDAFDDWDKPNAMRDAVEREKAALALPTPQPQQAAQTETPDGDGGLQ